MKSLTFLISLIVSTFIFGQSNSFVEEEEKLLALLNELRSAENNSEKNAANLVFKTELAKVL